eukprot:2463795-Alexandrium_andersonii.AAC.1
MKERRHVQGGSLTASNRQAANRTCCRREVAGTEIRNPMSSCPVEAGSEAAFQAWRQCDR